MSIPYRQVRSYDKAPHVKQLTVADVDPGVTNDVKQEFDIGSQWFNKTTGVMFICTGQAVGAATWSSVSINAPAVLLASGSPAIDPHTRGIYQITKGSIAAMTLAAPTAVVDDGKTIEIVSTTAFAHTLTATGLLQTGSANVNVATFAAFAGARIKLQALNAHWQVVSSVGITFS